MSVLVRDDRVVLRLYGRDPIKMIQGLATNDVAKAAVDESVYTAFLTPKGKMIADARVMKRANGDVWVEADRTGAENLVAHFKKSIPPLFARVERLDELAIVETTAEDVAGIAVFENPYRNAHDVVVNESEAATMKSTLTRQQAEISRIEAGEPRWGSELTEDVIPLEAGLRHVAISETKGCYTGQEVIIRILHRGHVNRHLRGLRTGAYLVEAGSDVEVGDKVVGKVTSACFSPTLNENIALAYVRREVAVGSEVEVAGHPARMVELPFIPSKEEANR